MGQHELLAAEAAARANAAPCLGFEEFENVKPTFDLSGGDFPGNMSAVPRDEPSTKDELMRSE